MNLLRLGRDSSRRGNPRQPRPEFEGAWPLDGADYVVFDVLSDTELTLVTPFTGTTGSGKAYTIQRQFFSLEADLDDSRRLGGRKRLSRRAIDCFSTRFSTARHERLGDAMLAAQSAYARAGAFPELITIYHLFGDPALGLR